MEPTLDVGQRVLVNRFLYHFTDPKIGDIVVFHPPQGADGGGGTGECGDPRTGAGGSSGAACDRPTRDEADVNFIKRIVAGPGDTLTSRTATPSSTARSPRRASSDPARRAEPAICRNRSRSRPISTS